MKRKVSRSWLASLSPGLAAILGMLAVSSVLVAWWPERLERGDEFWIFARPHELAYAPLVERWNREHPAETVRMRLIQYNAFERRMLSGFLSGTPVGAVLETERFTAARAFAGPLDKVGFADLTDVVKAEGLLEQINPASFSLWTSRGRIFGIPHDVHPCVLVYRADIIEGAGIDLSRVETWDDYFAALRPLMADRNGDGRPDRFPLGTWYTFPWQVEAYLLQAGGRLFDQDERPVLNDPINRQFIARYITWCVGPGRVAIEAPDDTAMGAKLRLDGTVLGTMVPDWRIGAWKVAERGLAGKLKAMPVPAWQRGGRRTSVWGGTMLAVAKSAPAFAASWDFAKYMYLSPELADALYSDVNILTPVKKYWSRPVFHQPDAFFGGQQVGQLLIELAPHIPERMASPYTQKAIELMVEALAELADHAARTRTWTPAELEPTARVLLEDKQQTLERLMHRNVFLKDGA